MAALAMPMIEVIRASPEVPSGFPTARRMATVSKSGREAQQTQPSPRDAGLVAAGAPELDRDEERQRAPVEGERAKVEVEPGGAGLTFLGEVGQRKGPCRKCDGRGADEPLDPSGSGLEGGCDRKSR